MEENIRKIYDLSSIPEESYEIVGNQAEEFNSLVRKSIPIPQAFVLSSKVFDDFIVLNDLVGFLQDRLIDVQEDNNSIEKSAKAIANKFKDAKVPDYVVKEVETYYKKFSGMSKTTVRLAVSSMNAELDDSMRDTQRIFNSVYGVDEILEKIKDIWSNFFSAEAMRVREVMRYEGPLSLAIIIMKEQVSEVSAQVDTNYLYTNGKAIEIEAIAGNIEPLLAGDLVGDRYIFSLTDKELLEKRVMEQKWMQIFKFSRKKLKKTKVDISKTWNNKQKLSDAQVERIAQITSSVMQHFNASLILNFTVEMGKVYLTGVRQTGRLQRVDREEGLSNYEQLRQKLEVEEESVVQEEDEKPSRAFEVEIPEPPAQKQPKKTIDMVNYVSEVEAEVSPKQKVESKPVKVEEVKAEKLVKTAIQVYASTFNSTDYKRYKKNIEGLINISGDEFFIKMDTSVKDILKNKKKYTDELIKYISEVVSKVNANVLYTFSSEFYKGDDGASYGAPRIIGGASLIDIELAAIRNVRNTLGHKNLWVSIPGFRDDEEYMEVKRLISLAKLRRSPTFKVFATIDNTASALLIEDLIEVTCDGFIYDLDKLSKNVLGYFIPGETPTVGVRRLLKQSLKVAGERKAQTIVIGDSIETSYKLQNLVKYGITGVAVPIDKIMETKKALREIEGKALS